jgi:hypothetical protein
MPDTLNKQEQIALQITTAFIPLSYTNGLPENEDKRMHAVREIVKTYLQICKILTEMKV